MSKNIVLVLIFFASFLMQAQVPVSVHLSEKKGLPDKEFYSILEDDKGFIWLCADKGLFRYNGKSFKKYTHTDQIGLSVFNVQQDALKRVWCNNVSGQFFYTQDNTLHLFTDLSKVLKGELADFVVKDNFLWVFSLYEIYKVNLKTKELKTIVKSRQGLGVPFNYDNTIYFQNRNSISSITNTNYLKHLLPIKQSLLNKKGAFIGQGKSRIFKIGNAFFLTINRFNITTFFQFNIAKKTFKPINGFESVINNRIYSIFEHNNEIWLATDNGVWIFEFKINHFQFKKQFLKGEDVTKTLKDKDDNYWFITLNNGIYIIPNINIETSNLTAKNKNISSLDKVNDSTLVLGLINGNIALYSTNTNTTKIINLPTKDIVSTLKHTPNTNSTIISKDRSSYIFNHHTLKYSSTSNKYLSVKSFSIIEKDILLYTSHNNVVLLNKTKPLVLEKKRGYESFYDKKNKATYIALVDELVCYDSIWKRNTINYKGKSIYGKSITKSTNGVVWVATYKDGVFGIKNNAVIYHYTIKNGLTSNHIAQIKADKNTLWIAQENSIQVLDITTKRLKTLTKNDGVLSYDISGIAIINTKVYFSSHEGLFSVDKNKSFKTQQPEVYFNSIEINEKDTLITSNYTLKYNQNAIKIGFNATGFSYSKIGKYKFRLKGFNNNWLTTDVGTNSVKYNSLPSGKYTFQVQPLLENQSKKGIIKELHIKISSPFWETWWFIWGIALFVVIATTFYYRYKIKKKEEERVVQLEKISLEKELIAINLTALRSQMNPHFIFNALNSIQDLVLKKDTDASYDYIVLFAELIRNALSYSNQDFISIEKELNFLKVYLQLENLRFGDDFKYSISFNSDESLDIPSLLIQPFIENALVHGLLHKTGKKMLDIEFSFINNVLECVITDNGIGRKKAAEISNRQGNHHDSFALGAIEKRLEIFRKQFNEHIGYVIHDLYENQNAKGTRIIVTMPFKKRF